MQQKNRRILVLGATSAMARATMQLYAKEHCSFMLVGRDTQQLEILKSDLIARGANDCFFCAYDAEVIVSQPAEVLVQIQKQFASFDTCILAYGYLGDQLEAEKNPEEATKIINVNYTSAVAILLVIAEYFRKQKSGVIVGISSVAGDRGRKSNFIYGSAKAGFSAFLEGLRQSLYADGVHVLTIKPGFVESPMTRHIKKNFLFAKPDVIAHGIYKGIQDKKDVMYLPWFWYWILLLVKVIPNRIFKKM